MSPYQFVPLVLVISGLALALSRAVGAPPSLVLFPAGLASTVVLGLPELRIDPQLALSLFLPPLVYASTVRISWHLLRLTLVPDLLYGVATVTSTVATAAQALLPRQSWTAALLLGVVGSVFDTRLFHEAKGNVSS